MTTEAVQQDSRRTRRRRKRATRAAGFDWRPRTPVIAVVQQVLILVLVFASIAPLVVALITSFYPSDGFTSGRIVPPFADGTLDNYFRAWNDLGFDNMFKNSSILTIASAIAVMAIASVAAYGLTRFSFIGRGQVLGGLIVGIAIPPIVIIIPLFLTMTTLNMVNHLYSAILVEIGLLLPFAVFLMYTFMRDLPQDLFDAAALDGAGHWRQFWHIALPLSRSGLVAMGVIVAIFAWNDLLIPLIFWQKESLETLMAGLATLGPGRTSARAVPLLMAGVSISIIPLIVLFLGSRRALVRGLTEGSVR